MNLWWDLTRSEHVRQSVGPDFMSMAQLLSVAAAVALTLRFSPGTASDVSASSSVRNELTLANER